MFKSSKDHVALTFLALQMGPYRLPKSVYLKIWQALLEEIVKLLF